MSQGRSVRGDSRRAVMSAKDLGLSPNSGKYLKPPRGKRKVDKLFSEPVFRVPYQMAYKVPARRSEPAIRPLPWLEAAIEAGIVVTASLSEVSQGGQFLTPLKDDIPYVTREQLEQQLREGMEMALKDLQKDHD